MDWSEWIQSVGAGLIDKRYELERLKLEQRGMDGNYYSEGQPRQTAQAAPSINPTILLLGAVVLVVVLMRK